MSNSSSANDKIDDDLSEKETSLATSWGVRPSARRIARQRSQASRFSSTEARRPSGDNLSDSDSDIYLSDSDEDDEENKEQSMVCFQVEY